MAAKSRHFLFATLLGLESVSLDQKEKTRYIVANMKYGLIITVLLLVLASIHVLMLASTDEDHLVDVVYTKDSFITVDNTSKGPMYNLAYGEITEVGIESGTSWGT